MSISDTEAARHYREWLQHVEQHRQTWARLDAAYNDRYWSDSGERSPVRSADRFEKNRLRGWLQSYRASLFHRRIRATVEADDVVYDGSYDEATEKAKGTQAVLNRFYARRDIEREMRTVTDAGLMYDWCGWQLVDTKGKHPLDRYVLEIVPPWEIGWDREARSVRQQRWRFRTYYESVERLKERWDIDDDTLAKLVRRRVPDALTTSHVRTTESNDVPGGAGAYVKVLEFYDLVAMVQVLEDDTEKRRGAYRVYAVDTTGASPEDEPYLKLHEGPIPYEDLDGNPLPPFGMWVAENRPARPSEGSSPAASVYEHTRVENFVLSILLQSARRDTTRPIPYDANVVTDDDIAQLAKAGDGEYVPLANAGGRPIGELFHPLQHQPVAPSIMELYDKMREGLEQVQGTAPVTRGEPTRYLTATQSEQLVAYSETKIGEVKKRQNEMLEDIGRTYLRMLRMTLKGTVTIRGAGGQTHELVAKDFDRWLHVEVSDVASTPADEASRRQVAMMVYKVLLELAEIAGQGGPAGVVSEKLYDYIVELFDLPVEFKWGKQAREAVKQARDAAAAEMLAKQRGESLDQLDPELTQGGQVASQ